MLFWTQTICMECSWFCVRRVRLCVLGWHGLEHTWWRSVELLPLLHFVAIAETCKCVVARFRSCFYAHLMCRRCIIFNWSNINFPSNERAIFCIWWWWWWRWWWRLWCAGKSIPFVHSPFPSFSAVIFPSYLHCSAFIPSRLNFNLVSLHFFFSLTFLALHAPHTDTFQAVVWLAFLVSFCISPVLHKIGIMWVYVCGYATAAAAAATFFIIPSRH